MRHYYLLLEEEEDEKKLSNRFMHLPIERILLIAVIPRVPPPSITAIVVLFFIDNSPI